MISIIFMGVLGVFFVLLVVLTIALIVTKKKGNNEDEEYDEEYDEDYEEGSYDEEYNEEYADENEYDGDETNIDDNDEEYDYDKEITEELIGDADPVDMDENSDINTLPLDSIYSADEDLESTDELTSDVDGEPTDELTSDVDGEPTDELTSEVDGEPTDELTSEVDGEETDELTSDVDGEETDELTSEVDGEETDELTSDVDKEETDELTSDAAATLAGQATDYATDIDDSGTDEVVKKALRNKKKNNEALMLESMLEDYTDSAFAPEPVSNMLSNEEISASVKEAEAMSQAVKSGKKPEPLFGVGDELDKYGKKKAPTKKSNVSSDEEFYWYNKMDVAEKPSYKTEEMYYHYFNLPDEIIEDLLIEMYDCALVRTEEIKYIAYGIEPRTVSIKEILSEGNYHYSEQKKKKNPAPQDLVRIYEKWCGYVDKLFDKVEIHADELTITNIRAKLCEFGRNDVDVLIEGK